MFGGPLNTAGRRPALPISTASFRLGERLVDLSAPRVCLFLVTDPTADFAVEGDRAAMHADGDVVAVNEQAPENDFWLAPDAIPLWRVQFEPMLNLFKHTASNQNSLVQTGVSPHKWRDAPGEYLNSERTPCVPS